MIATRNVLVVEPADDDRGGFANTLRDAGLAVDSAPDAARALAGIASNQHAMIVIDPTTPGLNAGALVEALRQTSPRPVALVLAEDVQRVRGFGADVIHGYIRRGAESDQLVELVRDCLAALRESRPHVGRVLNPSQAARRPPFGRQTD